MKTKMWMAVFSGVAGLAAAAHGQSLRLMVETGAGLGDGILDPLETASFTVRVQGTGGPEAYRALASLFGFTMGGFGPGTFTQTGQNSFLTGLPGSPGLVYDNDAGTISMLPTGGFVQLAGILPVDDDNPVFLFSFDWVPSGTPEPMVHWAADATHGTVYVGGDPSQPVSWTTLDVAMVDGSNGAFTTWTFPTPSTAGLFVLAAAMWTRRR